jgi:hypothetical protein
VVVRVAVKAAEAVAVELGLRVYVGCGKAKTIVTELQPRRIMAHKSSPGSFIRFLFAFITIPFGGFGPVVQALAGRRGGTESEETFRNENRKLSTVLAIARG